MAKARISRPYRLAAVALLGLALNAKPALAQFDRQADGYDSHFATASWATDLARYYTPYALQAAAAYISVERMDATRLGPQRMRPDIALAVSEYPTEGRMQDRARLYLRPWRYQFGSEGHLDCFGKSQQECERILQSRWTFAVRKGPAFHVWARTGKRNAPCREVSIAFRGTEATSVADWISNFRFVGQYLGDDYYAQLNRHIDSIIGKIKGLNCYNSAQTQIVSVGHSLGGGLAQFAALAHKPTGPRIAKVFAFDTSPVTAASLVAGDTLAQNTKGLQIDRIYQNGEVLEELRDARDAYSSTLSRCDPYVRTVVFDVMRPTGSNSLFRAISLHTMSGLSGRMVQLSYDDDQRRKYKTPRHGDCKIRYRVPGSDRDEVPVAARGGTTFAGVFGARWPRPAARIGIDGPSAQGIVGPRAVPAFVRQAELSGH